MGDPTNGHTLAYRDAREYLKSHKVWMKKRMHAGTVQLQPDLSEECCLSNIISCNAVMLIQLYLDLSEECCLPNIISYNAVMIIQLYPHPSEECCLPIIISYNAVMLIQLHPNIYTEIPLVIIPCGVVPKIGEMEGMKKRQRKTLSMC